MQPHIEANLVEFLMSRLDAFAWQHRCHHPQVKRIPKLNSIQHKRKKFGAERNQIINEEVNRILKACMIKEMNYPEWLANIVIVQKKNRKWRVCVEYIDLNKAYVKDPYPLPHIDNGRLNYMS